MQPLFDCIVNNIPAPEGDPDADTQMLISTIDYNEFVGRIGVGKIENGKLKVNQEVAIVNHHDPSVRKRVRITKLYTFSGLNKVDVPEASFGVDSMRRRHSSVIPWLPVLRTAHRCRSQ